MYARSLGDARWDVSMARLKITIASLALAVLGPSAHAQETWIGEEGAVTLSVPSGWVNFEEYLFLPKDNGEPKSAAICHFTTRSMPVSNGLTQEMLNTSVDKMLEHIAATGTPLHYARQRSVSGVRVLEFSHDTVENGKNIRVTFMQFGFLSGQRTYAYNIDCGGETPMPDRASNDISAFLDSLQIESP
jgi:hypothetical protein